MTTQYDKLVKYYKKGIEKRIKLLRVNRKYALEPSLFKLLRNVKGKSVLDLACGEGHFTRLIKNKGASKVVGIDISKEMIKLAKKKEKRKPLGIEYFTCNVTNLPKLGEFDLAIGTLLLHYSKTKTELLRMCKNTYKNLKSRGRFIALNSDPENPLQSNKKYDFIVTAKKPLKEGDALILTLFADGKKVCSFQSYFWKKKTYENALKRAGFKTIKWHKITVSEEGIKKFGSNFWKEYLKNPSVVLIECKK